MALFATAMIVTLATLVPVEPSYGQATTAAGAIQGTISDTNGAAIQNAEITLTNLGTNVAKKITTDSSGFYGSGSLVPGQYTLSVTATGFSTTTVTLTVQIGNVANGNVKLQVGSATEQVEVSASDIGVNTTQSTVGGVLTSQQIDSMPLSGRNFLDLAQLEPGVQLQAGESFDPTKAGYSSVSISGVNGRTARILLDGQDISDETVGTTTLNVSSGSIEEFEISRSSLDISNELTSSGSVTVSTRSGTNKVHGQAFGLFRDDRSGAAAAPGGFDYPFQRNQFGGRAGGPILKDKLFLFGNSERIKQDSFNSVQVSAPFTALNGGYTSPFRDNYSVGRLDYNAPMGMHLFFRGSYENNLDDATYGYGFSRYGNKDNTFAFAGGADFVTGKYSHSLRWSYLKFHNLIGDQTGSGVPLAVPGIELFFSQQNLITGPNLLAPQQTYQSDKQVRYDGGLTIRTHQLQYGFSFNRILGGGFASFYGLAPEVDGNFSGGVVAGGNPSDPTAYTAADIVMGNGEGYNTEHAGFGAPAGGQGDYRLGVYAGDTWKLTPKLTVNYGIRYSRDTGRSDSDLAPIPCSAAVAVWGANSPCTSGNLLDAVGAPLGTSSGLGSQVRQPNADFGPKAGFAYDPKGDGKTIIRGGLGLYFENNIFNNVLFDRPARLSQGLFWNDKSLNSGATSFTMPDGTIVTSIDGVSLGSLWNDPISVSGPYFAKLQQMYQSATAGAGPTANGSYVANSLSEGPNGLSLYAPNFQVARSVQINFGFQRELWKKAVLSTDYVRSVSDHIQQSIDVNHVGDAQFLNTKAAQNAISTVTSSYAGCSGGYSSVAIDCAIANGATIATFAAAGLDSGNAKLQGSPAAALGSTPDTGAAFAGQNPMFGRMAFNFPMGRSTYNALQMNLRQDARLPIAGLKSSNFDISYTLSRFTTTGGGDQNFTPGSVDNNHPLSFAGPGGLDRTNQVSYGATLDW
jgi:hypothetical protein